MAGFVVWATLQDVIFIALVVGGKLMISLVIGLIGSDKVTP